MRAPMRPGRERSATKHRISGAHGVYALIEVQGSDAAPARFSDWLEEAFGIGLIADAAVAQSATDLADFWALREAAAEVGRLLGPCLGFDIGVPPKRIGDWVAAAQVALAAALPQCSALFFGHAGDGNIHVMLAHEAGFDPQLVHAADAVLYRLAADFGGTITAEHGVGSLKRDWLGLVRSPDEIAAMRRLKAAFDPKGILGPGKVLPLQAQMG